MRAAITARRRTIGASLGALPVANVVVIEVGLAAALILLAIDRVKLLYIAVGVLALALLIAFLRWSGRWFTQWVGFDPAVLLPDAHQDRRSGAVH